MNIEISDDFIDAIADRIILKLKENCTVKEAEPVKEVEPVKEADLVKEAEPQNITLDDVKKEFVPQNITLDDVKKEFVRMKRIGKSKEAKELLKQYDTERVSGIRVEDYPEIIEIARSIE